MTTLDLLAQAIEATGNGDIDSLSKLNIQAQDLLLTSEEEETISNAFASLYETIESVVDSPK